MQDEDDTLSEALNLPQTVLKPLSGGQWITDWFISLFLFLITRFFFFFFIEGEMKENG